MINKGLRYWIFHILKYFCIAYVIVGLVLWVVGLVHTDYNAIHIYKWMVGDDGSVGYQWETHDKSWQYFDNYTYPFAVLTFPIYMIIASLVSEGKISFLLNDIFIMYLIFIPYLLLFFCILLKKTIRKLILNL